MRIAIFHKGPSPGPLREPTSPEWERHWRSRPAPFVSPVFLRKWTHNNPPECGVVEASKDPRSLVDSTKHGSAQRFLPKGRPVAPALAC
jgi:hypothetical protein